MLPVHLLTPLWQSNVRGWERERENLRGRERMVCHGGQIYWRREGAREKVRQGIRIQSREKKGKSNRRSWSLEKRKVRGSLVTLCCWLCLCFGPDFQRVAAIAPSPYGVDAFVEPFSRRAYAVQPYIWSWKRQEKIKRLALLFSDAFQSQVSVKRALLTVLSPAQPPRSHVVRLNSLRSILCKDNLFIVSRITTP